jgi:hypothetical protein
LAAPPFEFSTGSVAEVIAATFTAAILLLLVTACFVKQRVLHGALGLFLWPIALYGAAPVAKPGSPCAKWFYADCKPGQANEGRETYGDAGVRQTHDACTREVASRRACATAALASDDQRRRSLGGCGFGGGRVRGGWLRRRG